MQIILFALPTAQSILLLHACLSIPLHPGRLQTLCQELTQEYSADHSWNMQALA